MWETQRDPETDSSNPLILFDASCLPAKPVSPIHVQSLPCVFFGWACCLWVNCIPLENTHIMSGFHLTSTYFPTEISTLVENCSVQFSLLVKWLQSSSLWPQHYLTEDMRILL